jgi:hypothetical protein
LRRHRLDRLGRSRSLSRFRVLPGGLLELSDALSDRASDLGQFARPDYHKGDDEDYHQMCWRQSEHEIFLPLFQLLGPVALYISVAKSAVVLRSTSQHFARRVLIVPATMEHRGYIADPGIPGVPV